MDIKFDKHNFRKHSDRNKELIRKSLDECGAGRSILVDNENEIIAGNGVYEQAKAQGIPVKVVETDGSELVVVKRTDLSTNDERRKKLALADNATADNVEWDDEALHMDFDTDELDGWGIDIESQSQGQEPFDEVEEKKIDPFGKNFILLEYAPSYHAEVMDTLAQLRDKEYVQITQALGGHAE